MKRSFGGVPRGTYAQPSLARPGGRFVALGDSITAGAVDNAGGSQGDAWPFYASLMSQGRLQMVRNAGVFGNKTADMIARFSTDVTPYAPNVVTIAGGTNDYANSVTFATFRANIATLVGLVRGINAVPVLATIPPRDSGGYEATIEQWNAWLRDYAQRNGISVLDFYALLTDPANSHYKAGYASDGTHPNAAGYADMGEVAAVSLAGLTPNGGILLPVANTPTNNLLVNGLFLGAGSGGVASSWTAGSAPTGVVKDLFTDAAVPGQMQRFTMTAASGLWVLNQVVSTGFSTGDTLRFCGVISTDGGAQATVHVTLTGGTPAACRPVYQISKAVTRGVFCQDVTLTAAPSSITFGLECGAAGATGVVSFGQCAILNLTTMGTLL